MKKPVLLIILTSLLLSIACAATGPVFKPEIVSNNTGIVYIYRPDVFCLSARSVDINVDQRQIGMLKNGGYLWVRLPPGPHLISTKGVENLEVSSVIQVLPGRSHYVKWKAVCRDRVTKIEIQVMIGEVYPEVGLSDIRSTRLSR